MRTFGYFLAICGLGLAGYGIFLFIQSTKSVKVTEKRVVAARATWESSKGTDAADAARAALEQLHLQILAESVDAAAEKSVSKWWMTGGGIALFLGLLTMVLGKPKRRRTRSNRFWA